MRSWPAKPGEDRAVAATQQPTPFTLGVPDEAVAGPGGEARGRVGLAEGERLRARS